MGRERGVKGGNMDDHLASLEARVAALERRIDLVEKRVMSLLATRWNNTRRVIAIGRRFPGEDFS